MSKETYTAKELADALGVSNATVYSLIRTDSFPSIRVGGKYLIPVTALREWLAKCAAEKAEIEI